MEASPLVQQSRPDTFQPKVVLLYQRLLLQDEEEQFEERTEGFWRELFLLKPDSAGFRHILDELSADDLLHLQSHTQEFVYRSLACVETQSTPSDDYALEVSSPMPTYVTCSTYEPDLDSLLRRRLEQTIYKP